MSAAARTADSRLAEARRWFEDWRSPSEFDERLNNARPMLDRGRLLYRREGQWFREAWTLTKYAQITLASAIRLGQENGSHDAFVKFAGTEIPIQITEVMEIGRKPSKEYSGAESRVWHDPVEEWSKRALTIPGALRERIAAKCEKTYSADTELLIYLNINEWGIEQRKIEAEIISQSREYRRPFAVVHVLWKEKLFSSSGEIRCHPNPLEYEFDDVDDCDFDTATV